MFTLNSNDIKVDKTNLIQRIAYSISIATIMLSLAPIAQSAPIVGGFVQPMPNEFWPYNTTNRQTGTIDQQKSPFENPDVFCAQEDYRLPALNEYTSQFSDALPWWGSGDTSLIMHWSTFPNNDITKQFLPKTAAGVRSVGRGVFNEWGNLGSYATATYENGNYVSGWNQTWYWVTEPTVQSGQLGRYVINNTTGTSWSNGTVKYGVVCVFDLVPTPANS
ncbi:hypothetical protein [Thorsellia anophelis]|nr:hypothetical protein [Thorsellia anophelis]